MNCITSAIELPLLRSNLSPNRRQRKHHSQSQPPENHHIIFRQIHISPQIARRFVSTKAIAIPSSLVLANSTIPPSQSGDLSVLLPTGGVLLTAYLIANFIFPELIMKSSSSDESDGRAAAEEEETGAGEGRKKRGFGGNKR